MAEIWVKGDDTQNLGFSGTYRFCHYIYLCLHLALSFIRADGPKKIQ